LNRAVYLNVRKKGFLARDQNTTKLWIFKLNGA
jgi:hypothetical protein